MGHLLCVIRHSADDASVEQTAVVTITSSLAGSAEDGSGRVKACNLLLLQFPWHQIGELPAGAVWDGVLVPLSAFLDLLILRATDGAGGVQEMVETLVKVWPCPHRAEFHPIQMHSGSITALCKPVGVGSCTMQRSHVWYRCFSWWAMPFQSCEKRLSKQC